VPPRSTGQLKFNCGMALVTKRIAAQAATTSIIAAVLLTGDGNGSSQSCPFPCKPSYDLPSLSLQTVASDHTSQRWFFFMTCLPFPVQHRSLCFYAHHARGVASIKITLCVIQIRPLETTVIAAVSHAEVPSVWVLYSHPVLASLSAAAVLAAFQR